MLNWNRSLYSFRTSKKRVSVFPTARTNEDVKKLQDLGFEALYLDLSSSDSIKSAVFKLYEKTDLYMH
jgi:hypothetical protein